MTDGVREPKGPSKSLERPNLSEIRSNGDEPVRTGKRVERRYAIAVHGVPIMKLLSVQTAGGETIVRLLRCGVRSHLSVYGVGGQLRHHVTHEAYPPAHGRRHTQRAALQVKAMVNLMLPLLAPEDDPPPIVRSLHNDEDARALGEWLERVTPRIIRPPSRRRVYILKGPLGDLVDRFFANEPLGEGWTLDVGGWLDKIADMKRIKPKEVIDAMFEEVTEIDLVRTGRRLALYGEPPRAVIALQDGNLVELNLALSEQVIEERLDALGIGGYLRTAERQAGSLVDVDAITKRFREFERAHQASHGEA